MYPLTKKSNTQAAKLNVLPKIENRGLHHTNQVQMLRNSFINTVKTGIFFSVIGLSAMFLGCSKEETQPKEVTQISDALFTIENGYVRFRDVESFNSTMKVLNSMSISDLSQWESKNQITNSLRAVQSYDTVNLENTLVVDMRFAAVISSDGKFAIGDSMHLITKDNEYIYPIGSTFSVSGLKSSSSEVRVFEIVKEDLSTSKLKSWADKWFYFDTNGFDLPSTTDGLHRKVKAYVWSTTYTAYCSNGIGLWSYVRAKNIWGQKYWKDSPCNYITVGGQTAGYVNGEEFQVYDQDTDTNCYKEQCTLKWGVGTIYTRYIYGDFDFKQNDSHPVYSYNGIWE